MQKPSRYARFSCIKPESVAWQCVGEQSGKFLFNGCLRTNVGTICRDACPYNLFPIYSVKSQFIC